MCSPLLKPRGGRRCVQLGSRLNQVWQGQLALSVQLGLFSGSERHTDLASRFEADTNIRMRFVVGLLQDPVAQAALHEEQQAHKDFLVVNVQETYNNLVLKVQTCHHPSVDLRLVVAYATV